MQESELRNTAWLVFTGWVVSWVNEMRGRIIPVVRGKGHMGPSRNWAPPTTWPFTVSLKTAMALLGGYVIEPADVLQRPYNEAEGLLEVESSVILDPVGSNQLYHVLQLCHSFTGCALPPSPLFQMKPDLKPTLPPSLTS